MPKMCPNLVNSIFKLGSIDLLESKSISRLEISMGMKEKEKSKQKVNGKNLVLVFFF